MSPSTGGHVQVFLGPFWQKFHYFLRAVHNVLMKFCRNVLGITQVVTRPKKINLISHSGGSHFGAWFMFLCFLRTIQYFLMKFYGDVLGITVMVTTLTPPPPTHTHMFPSAGGHFGVFWGPFWHMFL